MYKEDSVPLAYRRYVFMLGLFLTLVCFSAFDYLENENQGLQIKEEVLVGIGLGAGILAIVSLIFSLKVDHFIDYTGRLFHLRYLDGYKILVKKIPFNEISSVLVARVLDQDHSFYYNLTLELKNSTLIQLRLRFEDRSTALQEAAKLSTAFGSKVVEESTLFRHLVQNIGIIRLGMVIVSILLLKISNKFLDDIHIDFHYPLAFIISMVILLAMNSFNWSGPKWFYRS